MEGNTLGFRFDIIAASVEDRPTQSPTLISALQAHEKGMGEELKIGLQLL